jgi:hypothetical protein
MNNRRNFLRFTAPAAAIAAAGATTAQAADGDDKEILGAWTTIHTLPFPPNWFREFLTFSSGGGLVETNTFLNMTTPQDFSAFGLPKAVTASDGMGNWERISKGKYKVTFRKLLYSAGEYYFGDLKVTGTIESDGTQLSADWLINVVDVKDNLVLPFGPANSGGTRIA